MPRGIPNQARDNPVLQKTTFESADLPLGHTVRVTDGTNAVGEAKLVQVEDRMPDQEHVAMLAFMNEEVRIRPATSTDQNAEQVFELTINGRTEQFARGQVKQVRRCYVDLMARLKVTSYAQRDVFNAEGVKQVVNEPRTALKYDFAMISDPNPMGEHWLKATLAMGG